MADFYYSFHNFCQTVILFCCSLQFDDAFIASIVPVGNTSPNRCRMAFLSSGVDGSAARHCEYVAAGGVGYVFGICICGGFNFDQSKTSATADDCHGRDGRDGHCCNWYLASM